MKGKKRKKKIIKSLRQHSCQVLPAFPIISPQHTYTFPGLSKKSIYISVLPLTHLISRVLGGEESKNQRCVKLKQQQVPSSVPNAENISIRRRPEKREREREREREQAKGEVWG